MNNMLECKERIMYSMVRSVNPKSLLLLLAGTLLLALVGCRTQPVYQAENRPFHASEQVTLQQIEQTIRQTGEILGWKFKSNGANELIGTLFMRKGRAVVTVGFTKSSYYIHYKDSLDLNYDGNSIHGSYNKMVRRLDNAIRDQLSGL